MSAPIQPMPETLYIGRFDPQQVGSSLEVYENSTDAYHGGDLGEAKNGRVCGVYKLVKTVRVKQVMIEEVISSTPASRPNVRKKTKKF